jgi:hypothetical protein
LRFDVREQTTNNPPCSSLVPEKLPEETIITHSVV